MLNDPRSRRTFAIISHPDAGKTTATEQLLLHGKAIALAGTVKSKKSDRYAKSDWMELEKQRGISVTTSVMQFPYRDCLLNLLDTPGHADFSEDTYRTLTAVDAAIMIIDIAKGVEDRTYKLMNICRQRRIPIITFVNKLDREGMPPLDVLANIEDKLNIRTHPMTWPVGGGKTFKGLWHIEDQRFSAYGDRGESIDTEHDTDMEQCLEACSLFEDEAFDHSAFLDSNLTPVYFGTALNNFGIDHLLDCIVDLAPCPDKHAADQRDIMADEKAFSGYVFKIQANMDPNHRDRIAFIRIASGEYRPGIKVQHVRQNKKITINQAVTFMAGQRQNQETAVAGDIIGITNRGQFQIGDTLSESENFRFIGIPNFAPELFKRVILDDVMKSKALTKGLSELCDEGATQCFRPLISNAQILGAVGVLQFDVVCYRLEHEYGVKCHYDMSNITCARWIQADNPQKLKTFTEQYQRYLGYDHMGRLVFLAPSQVNLQMAKEKNPDIWFLNTSE